MWASLAPPLVFLGLPGCSGFALDSVLQANVAHVPRLRTKYSLPEFSLGLPLAPSGVPVGSLLFLLGGLGLL